MNKLQKALRLNAIFSGISGFILILFNKQIANLFEITSTTVFLVIGIVLLFFASTIIYEIIKQRPIAILWIIVQDFLWVIGSFVLVAVNPFGISMVGNSTIVVIAFIVLFMGINQLKALAEIDSTNDKNYKQFRFSSVIEADKKSVWKVISDVANYDKVTPNIDVVKIISGKGRGMVRSCSHGKDSWTETCTMWVEEKAYSFEVNTSTPDYPYPFKFLKGTWEVHEIDNNTTKIIMFFDFQYQRKYQNWLLHPLLKIKFSKIAEELLNNWQKILEKKD